MSDDDTLCYHDVITSMTLCVITDYADGMARWDSGSESRLRRAAMTLFAEHGYDAVTVTQISERAGLTRRSFFRYFPDKREVLFAGSESLPPALADAVASADASLPEAEAVLSALESVGVTLLREVDSARERRTIIAGSLEIREREHSKLAEMARAIADGLRCRGTDGDTAEFFGRIAVDIFDTAFERSIDDDDPASTFPAQLAATFTRLTHLLGAAAGESTAPAAGTEEL